MSIGTFITQDSENIERSTNEFQNYVQHVKDGMPLRDAAEALYDKLTTEEQLNLLDGDEYYWTGRLAIIKHGYNVHPYVMGACKRLGIPGIRFVDGPRGCVAGHGTAFPVSMARGATWNPELEEQVGRAIGEEVREQGGNVFGGVCVNLPRHPAWGRIQETYSDQPVLLSAFGAALSRGVSSNAIPMVKHFACNSMENARFKVNVNISEADFFESYAPQFKAAIDAGAHAVMSAYNKINGEYCGQNSWLLQQVLRKDFAFDGIVGSDFVWGLRDVEQSIHTGLTIEEPFHQQRDRELRELIHKGRVSTDEIRALGVQSLFTQLQYYAQREITEPVHTMANAEHVRLARQVAEQSMVLLTNQLLPSESTQYEQTKVNTVRALPVAPHKDISIAVFGRLATMENTGDDGSSKVRPPYVVTPLEGLKQVYGAEHVVYCDHDDIRCDEMKITNVAHSADAAVIVVGYTANDEGEYLRSVVSPDMLPLLPEPRDSKQQQAKTECQAYMKPGMSTFGTNAEGGDRSSLRLNEQDIALIKAVSEVNPRTIVVVVAAGAVLMDDWVDVPSAVLLSWYSGMEGGTALANIISGRVSPCGRLPYAIARKEDDLPYFDADATTITYDHWFGQRLIQRRGSSALFPLGYGLSYETVTVEQATVDQIDRGQIDNNDQSSFIVTATLHTRPDNQREAIRNTPSENITQRTLRQTIQIYGTLLSADSRNEQYQNRIGIRELIGFANVEVSDNQPLTVKIPCELTALGVWDATLRQVVAPQGIVRVEVSRFWGDPEAITMEVNLK